MTEAINNAPSVRRHIFGFSGIIIALIGISFSILPMLIESAKPQPRKELSEELSELVVETKRKIAQKLKNKDEEKTAKDLNKSINWNAVFMIIAVIAGVIAIVLAALSWIYREDKRISGASFFLGGVSIALQFLWIALGVVIILAILVALKEGLDLT